MNSPKWFRDRECPGFVIRICWARNLQTIDIYIIEGKKNQAIIKN